MILLFYGPNQYAAKAKLKETIERYVAKNGTTGLERIEGTSTDAAQLLQSLATVPFLASSRLVVVEDLSQNKPAAEVVIAGLDTIPDSTNIIFYERNPDRRTSFFKTLNKIAKVAQFELLPPPSLQKWVRAKAQGMGGSISPQTAEYLIEQVGPDQWRLEQEIQKLTNYQSQISQGAIEQLVTATFSNSVFDMVDAIGRGDTRSALQFYAGLRSKGEDPYKILGMIGWQLHNLALVMAASELSDAEIAKKAKLAPFVIQKSRRAAGTLSEVQLRDMYRLLTETDYRLKTASLDIDMLVEQLIVNLSKIHQSIHTKT